MDSFNSPSGRDPLDRTTPSSNVTQPLAFGPPPDPGSPPGGEAHALPGRRGRGRVTRWVAGLGVAVLLAGGGVLGAQLAGASTAKPVSATRAGTAAAGTAAAGTAAAGTAAASGQAALSAALGSPASAGAIGLTAAGPAGHPRLAKALAGLRKCLATARHLRATGHRAAARAKARSCLRRYRRLILRLLGAEHGQVTFTTKKGTRTIAWERGVIRTDTGSSIVVRAADGTTWTWDLVGKTIVTRARHRVRASALATGERVFVIGPVVNGADDARLIAIRR